jgi:PASTA domain
LLSILKRIVIGVAVAVAFVFGLASTVYLSLRSSEVRVPEVVGKDRYVAEKELGHAGLNFRVRATRPNRQVKPDTVLFQLPRAGEVVKVGQTVAVDVSRVAKEGETSETVPTAEPSPEAANDNANGNAESGNDNANRPRRTRNANANDNANGNANANANRRATNANNRNANDNRAGTARPGEGHNANSTNANANSNRQSPSNTNSNSPARNQNANRARPTPTPPRTNPHDH